jgi:hypothetical protein
VSDVLAYTRPQPPDWLRRECLGFARAENVEALIRNDFTGRGGLFFDVEHGHLSAARVAVLWAGSKCVIRGSEKIGTMELVPPYENTPSTWSGAVKQDWMRRFYAREEWPHFRMTLSGPLCHIADDRTFFATVDHELLHADHKKDQYGAPRFNDDTGQPIWGIRPHDYEGFAGTTERYGADADGSRAIVSAGLKQPRFHWIPGKPFSANVCGTCKR